MAEGNAAMGGKAEQGKPGTHVSEHLSNERTYLSYLRTSVSLMSFGIAINRFSLFLVQPNSGPSNLPLGSRLVSSERLGVGMVALGMALLAWAAVHYRIMLGQIERGNFRPRPGTVMVLTVLMLVAGLTGVVWLFLG
jgi:putative membrane protein